MSDRPPVGLRRVAPADIESVGSDPVIEARVREAIRVGGPISFAQFMQITQYDPGHGYYRSPIARPGRQGDFLTAPEAHPLFGNAIARQVEDVWGHLGRPTPFVVREYGAGEGALAVSVLDGLRSAGSPLAGIIRYRVVEVDDRRVDAVAGRLAALGLADRLEPDDGSSIEGVVIANEVLDALPFHRVIGRPSGLREILVGERDGRLIDEEGDPTTPALAARLDAEGIVLANGQTGEICLAVDDWVAAAAAGLARGLVLIIDYGHDAAELYDARRRPHGTLAAYVRHTVHEDPYRHLGRQDVTAHVDLTAVERAAATASLDPLGDTTQGEFLASLGAGDLLLALGERSGTSAADYLTARSALVRMIDPAAMGRFRVLLYGRGLSAEPSLRGLSIRVARRARAGPGTG